jgi:hypothetical protein
MKTLRAPAADKTGLQLCALVLRSFPHLTLWPTTLRCCPQHALVIAVSIDGRDRGVNEDAHQEGNGLGHDREKDLWLKKLDKIFKPSTK